LSTLWPLTQAWYGDRLDPDYQPKSVEQLQALLTSAGLTTEFWQL
jgi:hypothetical protein